IDLNGDIASVQTEIEPVRFNNGEVWNAWADYDGSTGQLEVRWSESSARPAAAQLARVVDVATLLGADKAFIGFTAGTGSGWGDHDLLRWEFVGKFAPFPEPTSLVLVVTGAIGLGVYRLRSLIR